MKKAMMMLVGTAALLVNQVLAADIGDPAAELKIATWVKGKPVSLSACKGTNVVVVEFWATWCPPCRASIPHLTELQKKFKDKGVIFVGISTEDEATVKKFVAEMGDKMDYSVAVDQGIETSNNVANKEGQTSKNYMGAFNIPGIPHAFIVNKEGKIAWHGHPMQDLDKTLDEVLAGKYNVESFKKKNEAAEKLKELAMLIASAGDEKDIERLGKELEAIDKEVGGIMQDNKKFSLVEFKKAIKFSEIAQEYAQAIAKDADPAKIEEIAAKMKETAPADFKPEMMESIRMQVLIQQYAGAVTALGASEKVTKLTDKISAVKCNDAGLLNNFAWFILTDERIMNRDLKLALKLSKSAVEISEEKESAYLDTYAKALFENKSVKEAIEYQKKAIATVKDAGEIRELEDTLKQYQASEKAEPAKTEPAKTEPAKAEPKKEKEEAVPPTPKAPETK